MLSGVPVSIPGAEIQRQEYRQISSRTVLDNEARCALQCCAAWVEVGGGDDMNSPFSTSFHSVEGCSLLCRLLPCHTKIPDNLNKKNKNSVIVKFFLSSHNRVKFFKKIETMQTS